MFCPNKPGLTDRRDDHVSRARDGGEVACAGMHYRYGRIVSLLHKEKREGLAHDHAATEHDDMRAANRDAAFPEQSQTTQRRARNEAREVTERELRDIDGMKTVDVFRRIERANDDPFIDLFGRRSLDENAMDCGISVQLLDPPEQIVLCRICGQLKFHRMQPELPARFVLRSNVGARSGIVAD